MAFKDFGARFLARMMQHFNREIHIVTATSGDTGSAVADAFCELTNIPVSILYLSQILKVDSNPGKP